jgi:fatty acid desaturase
MTNMNVQKLAQSILQALKRSIQPIATFLRGVSTEGEQPPFFCHPWFYVCFVLSELFGCILLTHLILSAKNLWLYPALIPVLMLGQAGTWGTYMVLTHQGSHGTISKHPWVNRLLAEVGGILVLTFPRDIYYSFHISKHHHNGKLATPEDPDMRFWMNWGFKPGTSVKASWKIFWHTMFNPVYYLKFASKRIPRNFF